MRFLKKSLILLLLLALLLPLAPRAAADAELGDGRFAGKSWQEIVEDFLEEHGANPARVACGWCNTVTGEEQYFNGDQYMISGSMYKVPMNMIFAEKVHNGEISWTTFVGAYRYEYAQHATIVESNNDVARSMWEYLGGYQPYRHLLAPYMGEDPDTVDEKFYENNFSTPRQNIYALKLLQTESERFPRVIDKMLEAEPHKYFKAHEHTIDIAHKYGYYAEGSRLYLNDCAILYTEEPCCIVLFTDTVPEPYKLLADFCDLMIDYSAYSTAARREAERIAAEEAAIAAHNRPAPVPAETGAPLPGGDPGAVAPTAAPLPGDSPAAENSTGSAFGRVLLLILAASAAVYAALAALRLSRRGKLRLVPALVAILLAAAALVLCICPQRGAAEKPAEEKTAALKGDPQGTVTAFFDAFCAGDYAAAYEKLSGVSTLGLENAPPAEDAAAIWRAMEENREYRLYGACTAVQGGAVQQLVFTTLDLKALSEAVKTATEAKIESLATELAPARVYDDEGGYQSSFTELAYSEALAEVLAHAADYRTTVGLNVRLVRSGDDWLIEPDSALYSALTGGAVK
ncbi:MAG: hypothetical protein IJQ43_00525 [Oscillospiraceae bacterium]|nr:hypothetical protein [Oscillospiraceae bacterium]